MTSIIRPPILVHITPDGICRKPSADLEQYCKLVDAAVKAGVNVVQSGNASRAHLASTLQRHIEGRALLMINSDCEAALASDATGVHFPEAVDASDALMSLSSRGVNPLLIGRSAHSIEAAVQFCDQVDYLQIGTMFPSQTHPEKTQVEGLELMKLMRAHFSASVGPSPWLIGVGGIEAYNAGEVVHAGADGVAVIRAISGASSEREAASVVSTMKEEMAEALNARAVERLDY
ncbi:hypothetical protein CYMTET_53838 [Cymbomonas tetramitiformis]|uniref:Thiamine phosphate synthase/TenI domain-containing protein n=1 Tax=Cymbomonas tetramitiformis TaxID=36881 RepID=A0AAE0EPN7_9CHLO|nr:hypothetical protein CYMTET_53838 [Cymbomonas tetramitiformis]